MAGQGARAQQVADRVVDSVAFFFLEVLLLDLKAIPEGFRNVSHTGNIWIK